MHGSMPVGMSTYIVGEGTHPEADARVTVSYAVIVDRKYKTLLLMKPYSIFRND